MSSRPRQQPLDTPHVLARGSWPEARRIAEVLRTETIGGVLLHPRHGGRARLGELPELQGYANLVSSAIGPEVLHLHLTVTQWTGDGLLAIFFFVAGLELKREFVAGDLRDPRVAAVPVAAALGGGPAARGDLARGDQWHGSPGRLGNPDGHRHRVRTGSARRHRERPAGSAPDLPADPGGRRRPDRDHRDRLLLHRSPGPRSCCCSPCFPSVPSLSWCSEGSRRGGC